jgi:hypothetical protein
VVSEVTGLCNQNNTLIKLAELNAEPSDQRLFQTRAQHPDSEHFAGGPVAPTKGYGPGA